MSESGYDDVNTIVGLQVITISLLYYLVIVDLGASRSDAANLTAFLILYASIIIFSPMIVQAVSGLIGYLRGDGQ